MKKKILFIVLMLNSFIVFSQFNNLAPWMKNLDQSKDNTLQNLDNSFNNYWLNKDHTAKGSGYKPFMRWVNNWENQLNDDGTLITPKQIQDAFNYKKGLLQKNNNSTEDTNTVSNWQSMGPYTHINSGSWSSGQGRVNVIMVDPNNSSIIYMGTPAGGIWKSLDSGTNWSPLSDFLPQIGVSGIAIDYSNSNIIYIATGDKDASDTYSIGVLKSIDGGQTWNTTGLQFTNTSTTASDIYIDPLNSNNLWVATSVGLYKSTNAGVSWLKTLNENIRDVRLKPNNSNIVYAVSSSVFYKSIDGGSTFNIITSGLPLTSGRMVIDITPANSNYVYLLSANTDYSFQGLYKSTDSGENFIRTLNNTNIFENTQAWYDLALGVSDTNPEMVFTGVLNIWKSTNGGNAFIKINSWSSPTQATYTHADIHFLRYYNGVLYCGSDGGIYVSSNNGTSFTDKTATAQIGQFYKIAVSKQSSAKIAGGLQDNGGYALLNSQWRNYYGADGMDAAIDPNNSNKYYGFIQNGSTLYYSNNSGISLSGSVNIPSGITGNWVTPLDVNSIGELYAGFNNLYKLENNIWVQVSNLTLPGARVDKTFIDPSNVNTIYISDNKDLYKSEDKGLTFNFIYTFVTNITSICVANNNSNLIYVTTSGSSGSVFKSIDGGIFFVNYGQGLPNISKNIIKHQGRNTNNPVYVGTRLGVFYRDETLSSWVTFDTNLPNVSVTDLEIHLNDEKIIASTYGRGIWQSNIPIQLPPNEIALVKIFQSNTGMISCNSSELLFEVKNSGLNAINAFTINYQINATPYTYNWTGNLPSNTTTVANVPFINSIRGTSTVNANVVLVNDAYSDNNASTLQLLNNDSGLIGVVNNFETLASELITSETNLWQRGTPSGALLNTTGSETNAYGTNLLGNYPDNTIAYLYSQCYDLTQISNPLLKFKMAYDLELNWDIVYVQYSTNFGETWFVLGSSSSPNWYNSNQTSSTANNCYNCPGAQWTGTNTIITQYSHSLTALTGNSNVIFRFVFHSDESVTKEGAVIDDLVVEGVLSNADFKMEDIVIYPNPSTGIFTLNYGNFIPDFIQVFDISGKIIKTFETTKSTNRELVLDLKELETGMYFVKINKEKYQTIKIIIKN